MCVVSPSYTFTITTSITAAALNLLGQPTVTLGTNEIVLANLPSASANNTFLARYTTGSGNYEALDTAATGLGYFVGAGGAVTQGTSRATTVVLNKVCGAITLFSASGSATPASFTVTNSKVVATDTIVVNQKSGTDKYILAVTAVGAGSFEITFYTTGGTTTEQPVINFSVFKAMAS